MNADRQPGQPDLDAVWREMRGPLLGFIARRVSDPDVAEDILQDVMLRIHRHAGELTHVILGGMGAAPGSGSSQGTTTGAARGVS